MAGPVVCPTARCWLRKPSCLSSGPVSPAGRIGSKRYGQLYLTGLFGWLYVGRSDQTLGEMDCVGRNDLTTDVVGGGRNDLPLTAASIAG